MPSLKCLVSVLIILLNIVQFTEQTILRFCYKDPKCFQLNDRDFAQKFQKQLNPLLNEVTFLKIHQLRITQENYLTFFSHPMPKLKQIQFVNHDQAELTDQINIHNILTPKIVQKIFMSPFFKQLELLDLSNTKVEYKHFKFLETIEGKIQSNLNILYLMSCYLQKKAFKILSQKVNFQGKLDTIGLAQNSLVDDQSIDSLITMIKSPLKQKSQLKNLTVFSTAIGSQNLIRLLSSIQTQNMVSLNIGYNAYQHSSSFKIPFNNSLYQFMSKKNWTALKRLRIIGLDLDNQQLPFLKDIKLPNLQTLDIRQNYITDQYISQWINPQKMPYLNQLDISDNAFNDDGILTLVKHNFNNLKKLILNRNTKLTSKYLDYLCQINSSNWQVLDLSGTNIHEYSLKLFFQNRSFQNLEFLDLTYISQTQNLFNFINWKSMKKLKDFRIQNSDISLSFHKIVQQKISFPVLRVFSIGGQWINSTNIQNLVSNLKQFAPQLELLSVLGSGFNKHTVYFNISKIDYQNLPNQVRLISSGIEIMKPSYSNKLQVLSLVFSPQFYQTTFHSSFFNKTQGSSYGLLLWQNQDLYAKVFEYLTNILIFENTTKFAFSDPNQLGIIKLLFLKRNLNQYQEQYKTVTQKPQLLKDLKRQFTLPYLKQTNYMIGTAIPFLYYLNKVQLPHLNSIAIVGQISEKDIPLVNKIFIEYKNVKNIQIISSKVNCQVFNKLMQNVQFKYVKNVYVAGNQIQKSCFETFLSKHSTIKTLNLNGIFLQTGLFDEIIKKHDIMLQSLAFSNIQIGNQQFAKLADINRQFLLQIQSNTVNINGDAIKLMVNRWVQSQIKQKNITIEQINRLRKNNKLKMFPKLKTWDLNMNSINQQGTELLLQTGMPFIQTIQLANSANPNLFNTLFSYPNHFGIIQIKQADAYPFYQTIDPRSTRNVRELTLESQNLIVQDYKILSELDLNKLIQINFLMQNIYDCQMLKYLLKIIQNAQFSQIVIKNEKIKGKKLNDTCLSEHNPAQSYMRQLRMFVFVWVQQQAYIPNFYTYLYSQNQLLQGIYLSNCLVGDKILLQILQRCNIQNIIVAGLEKNLLTDASVDKFFNSSLSKVKQIHLTSNFITEKSLKNLVNKTLPELMIFDISQNQIGDEGIQYLVQGHYPKLAAVSLIDISLKRKGLLKLFEIDAPLLVAYDLSNNYDLSGKDFIQFFDKFPYQKFIYFKGVATNSKISIKDYEIIQKIINQKGKGVSFESAQNYHLQLKNKAVLQSK